jgi:FlaG/FlaF family flagellin (archaellin)
VGLLFEMSSALLEEPGDPVMPSRLTVDALRHAIEQAAGDVSTVSNRGTYVRVYVAAPQSPDAFRDVLDVLLTADAWGSSDGTGALRLWAALVTRAES